MDGLTVQSWNKWGHDFLYVNDAAGRTLGYFDRNSGLLHVADPTMRCDATWCVRYRRRCQGRSRPSSSIGRCRNPRPPGRCCRQPGRGPFQAARRTEIWNSR